MSSLLSIKEVAEAIGVHKNTAYKMAQDREIPAFKLAGKWRVKGESLERWLKEKAAEAEKDSGMGDFSEGLLP